MRTRPLPTVLVAVATAALTATATVATTTPAGAAFVPSSTGPNSATAPYMLPLAPGVSLTSLLTVGDSKAAGNGYEMVGIPDGLGAYTDGEDVTVLMNHELRDTAGIVRAHGEKGAFVSKLRVDPRTMQVESGEDFIKDVAYWNYTTNAGYQATPVAPAGAAAGTHTAAFARFCSGDLTDPGQLLNTTSGNGYNGQIYFANEESGNEGRVFGVDETGLAHQLPRLGLFSWENTLAAFNKTDKTVVMGNEDGPTNGSEMWVYVGTKTATGTPVDKAGLTNGANFVLDMKDETVSNDTQYRAKFGKGTAAPFDLAEVDWRKNGAQQNVDAAAAGLGLTRVEDGEFDPRSPNDFYFITTEGGKGATTSTDPVARYQTRDGGGIWKLSFTDVERPELGGSLTLLLDGDEVVPGGPKLNKPDNMTMDKAGNILIQEDPGGNDHLARVVAYNVDTKALGQVATFDPALFGVSNPTATTNDTRAPLTVDEESSGILDASKWFGPGAWLLDAQVHTPKNLPAGTTAGTVGEYVENGQLLLMRIPSMSTVYGGADGTYKPVSPARLLDTRTTTPIAGGSSRDLVVTGTGGVPASGVSSVVLNVTATRGTQTSHVTVYPAGATRPETSSLNFGPAQTVAGAVVAKLGTGGAISLYNSAGNADVIVDVVGYHLDPTVAPAAAGSLFVPLTPARVLDTRNGTGVASIVGPGQTVDLALAGKGGLPTAGVTAVVLNLTGTGATSPATHVTAFATGATRPATSTLNTGFGRTVANTAVVPVSSAGSLSLYNNSGGVDLIADVTGYYTEAPATLATVVNTVTPARLLDTRTAGGQLGAGMTKAVQVTGVAGVPAGAKAAVVTLTITRPSTGTHLTAYATGSALPATSSVNAARGRTVPNTVIVPLSDAGSMSITNNQGSTDVLVDVVGYAK